MIVFSENPENDLWRELLQYTYEDNIKRYLKRNALNADDDTINCIIGSFLQAYEYYKSAKDANLQIAPLLLYYGSTNLLYGTINLLSGKINRIANHGMKIEFPETMKFIADTNIKFFSLKDGGVHVVFKAMGYDEKLTEYGEWSLSEFLDSIAEINSEYISCYGKVCGKIAMLDVVKTPEVTFEKVYFDNGCDEDILELINEVDGLETSYLPLQKDRDHFKLIHKINSKNISHISYSGQPYLRASHLKNGKLIAIPTIFNMYIALFALATLCRYHPERWSPFVIKDATGEKLLFEKFLYYSRRIIPNIALNKILNDDIQYNFKKYEAKDTIKLVGEHQIQEMVSKEVRKQCRR